MSSKSGYMNADHQTFENDFVAVCEGIHRNGYKWGGAAGKTAAGEPYSLEQFVSTDPFLHLLGRWWGCSTPNLYFYDRTESDADAQVRWFHEAVEHGLDLPWLRIKEQQEIGTFAWEPLALEEKEKLREKQRQLLVKGQLAAKVVFDMFAKGQFKSSQSEKNQGWILVPLGEIIAYSFEWHLRRKAEDVQRAQPEKDLASWIAENDGAAVWDIWDHLMKKVGEQNRSDYYFDEIMLQWVMGLATNRENGVAGAYQDWWNGSSEGGDWFIRLAKSPKSVTNFIDFKSISNMRHKLIRFAQLIVEYWDFAFSGGRDGAWDAFLKRLRFSPLMEVDEFRTRNLVAFPTWMQWLRNGGEMVSTNAAFLVSGFYDTGTARRHARKIQSLFLLLTQPDIANHTIPKLMLARAGILAEATCYELRDCFSSFNTSIGKLADLSEGGDQVESTVLRTVLGSLRREAKLIKRVADNLAALPVVPELKYMRPCNLNTLLVEALGICNLNPEGNSRAIKVETVLATDLPEVEGDELQLRHVFLELILNALEAMSRTPRASRTLRLEAKVATDGIIILISDTGKGMDNLAQSRIFTPFFSTKKPKGMGLGLFNAKRIIGLHGGSIKLVASSPGQGTTVLVSFPKYPDRIIERGTTP